MKNNPLFEIVQKCKRSTYPQWGGYLRPDEIVMLMESGIISIDKYHKDEVERAKADKKNGICNPVSFYFYPKKEFLKMKIFKE